MGNFCVSNSTPSGFCLILPIVFKNEHLLLKFGFNSCNLFSIYFSKGRGGGGVMVLGKLHLFGKLLFTWLSLVVSMVMSFCAVLFPTRCLG